MKIKKFSNNKIGFSYKGVSVFATGTFGKLIVYGFAGLLILIGIAAIQNASNNRKPQSFLIKKNFI